MEREQLTALVLAAQKGDNNAISALFNAFQNTVYNIALRETKDPETAADVVQETFIEVIQTIGKLQTPEAFVSWLKTITYHQCTRYYRKKENKHERLVEEREDAPALFDTLEEENEEFIPDKAMESEEFRRTIRAFIDKLPDVQRSAIMMKYFDDLSVKEIAAVQGVSENTVLSRLYYGRNAIKAEVEAYEKRHDTKLHAIPFLPLFRLLFNEAPAQMPPVAAAAVAQAVGTATGVTLVAAGTAAGVGGAAAAAVATGVGVAVKAAAIPLGVKIAAGIAAVVITVTTPILIHQAVSDDEGHKSSSDHVEEQTTISTQPMVLVPADAVEYEGHYYKMYNESASWEDAATACEELGGHLATITSAEEQAFLSDYIYNAGKYCYWIGGHKVDGVWQWVNGEPMEYTNWSMGEPNSQTEGEDYIHMFGTEWIGVVGMKWVGEWNDASNNGAPYAGGFYDQSNFGYLCEWDTGRLVQETTTPPTASTESGEFVEDTTTTQTDSSGEQTIPTVDNGISMGTVSVPTSGSTAARPTTTRQPTSTTSPTVPNEPTIVVSDATAAAGDTVQITVRMKNNPGIVSAKVKVGYDANVLTLVGHANGDFATAGYAYGEERYNPFVINWCHATAPDSTAELLATLTFRVAKNAAPGDYPLTLTYSLEDDFFNRNWETVYFAADEGVVRVTATTKTTATTRPVLYRKALTDIATTDQQIKDKLDKSVGSFVEVIAPELPLSVRSDFGLLFSDGEGSVALFLRYSGSQSGEINVEKMTVGGTTQWYITSYHSDILDSLVLTHMEYDRPFNDSDFTEW